MVGCVNDLDPYPHRAIIGARHLKPCLFVQPHAVEYRHRRRNGALVVYVSRNIDERLHRQRRRIL